MAGFRSKMGGFIGAVRFMIGGNTCFDFDRGRKFSNSFSFGYIHWEQLARNQTMGSDGDFFLAVNTQVIVRIDPTKGGYQFIVTSSN